MLSNFHRGRSRITPFVLHKALTLVCPLYLCPQGIAFLEILIADFLSARVCDPQLVVSVDPEIH